ncbi:MAG: hypothetical protein GY868_13620 [Deltaproteobacteria bacterium]|nr:hypothetical protein [Deltaproteobacteria bacterium]
MKYFAITPEHVSGADITARLPMLRQKDVTYLYLRALSAAEYVPDLIAKINAAGITPLVPPEHKHLCRQASCGMHVPGKRPELLKKAASAAPALITCSCHDHAAARRMLDGPVDFCLLSPVFRPLSKPEDKRALLPRNRLKELAAAYGERLVLLGGLTAERIRQLQQDLEHDFSAAGISMFWEASA